MEPVVAPVTNPGMIYCKALFAPGATTALLTARYLPLEPFEFAFGLAVELRRLDLLPTVEGEEGL